MEQPGLEDLTSLEALARLFPTAELALAELAALRASLMLPRPVVHVISDVHGEYRKLRHVINNASGRLRPLVESLFGSRLNATERFELLGVLYYPHEQIQMLRPSLANGDFRRAWVQSTLRKQFEIVRELARSWRRSALTALLPREFRGLFEELLGEPILGRPAGYVDLRIEAMGQRDRDLAAVRAASRLVRNLSATEIIVAGDLGDRGPRIDLVIDYLMRQPNVALVWGNHDVSWMGAALGQPACIATVLRFSCRYGRLAQLEEGYGISLAPLEKLARTVYGNDPAERFVKRPEAAREDALLLARMEKAAAILQFKLEAQTIRRHPNWDLEHRNLLHRIDIPTWTIELEGRRHALLDQNFPTLSREDPYSLSPQEQECFDSLRHSFTSSARLWEQMSYVTHRGRMWLRRDDVLVFHACVPVDASGRFLTLRIDGQDLAGRAQFDALERIIRRAFRGGADGTSGDADWLWYLWAGPKSPLFGKDRMASFEAYFLADKSAHAEHKNPYFEMIHDADFCRRIGREFGMGENVLVVNGHVPVKIEKGEQPVKRGGNAVTIDGAFSEAYGDRGYTLILSPEGISLAEHHHLDSVEQVLRSGSDIVPQVAVIRPYHPPRKMADTDEARHIRSRMELLGRLITAYDDGGLLETTPQPTAK